MAFSSERGRYDARCFRASAAARAAGIALRKDSSHFIEISNAVESARFPIVTDDSAWRETTVEEAFFVVLLDARDWSAAHIAEPADGEEPLSDADRALVPLIQRDRDVEVALIARLEHILGGPERLQQLWEVAEIA